MFGHDDEAKKIYNLIFLSVHSIIINVVIISSKLPIGITQLMRHGFSYIQLYLLQLLVTCVFYVLLNLKWYKHAKNGSVWASNLFHSLILFLIPSSLVFIINFKCVNYSGSFKGFQFFCDVSDSLTDRYQLSFYFCLSKSLITDI